VFSEIGSIELDQSIYKKAVITIYDKHGAMMKRLFPKWEHRWVVLQQINQQWIKHLERRYYDKNTSNCSHNE